MIERKSLDQKTLDENKLDEKKVYHVIYLFKILYNSCHYNEGK